MCPPTRMAPWARAVRARMRHRLGPWCLEKPGPGTAMLSGRGAFGVGSMMWRMRTSQVFGDGFAGDVNANAEGRPQWLGGHRISGDAETLTQIDAPHGFVTNDLVRRSGHDDRSVMQDIGAVDDLEGLTHVVIGDQNADAARLEVGHEVSDIAHRDRIDARERLVEQDVTRVG